MDQRSPRRFSTGVPVRTMRALRVELLDGARLLGAGILDGLRLVEHRQTPGRLRQPRRAQEPAVGGDDQVDVRKRPASQRVQLGGRHRRRMRDERAAGRARSARSPPSSWPGATPARPAGWRASRRRAAPSAPAAATGPGWSCRVPCRRPGTRPVPAGTGDGASGPRRAGRAAAWRAAPSPASMRARPSGPRSPARVSASHRPATTRDQSRSPSPAAPSADTSAPASIRIASAKVSPRSAAVRSTWRNWSSTRRSRSRSTSTQRPRMRWRPSDAASNVGDLGGRQPLAVERHLHAEVEQRVGAEAGRRLAAHRGAHLRPRRPAGPPSSRNAHDHAGRLESRQVA